MSKAELGTGGFLVSGGQSGVDYRYADHVLTILTETPITIQNVRPDTDTSDGIFVADGADANITLAGVRIDTGGAAFQIADSSTGRVTVTLAEGADNRLKSGYGRAALEKCGGSGGTLTITGTGALWAFGGAGSAGIGGRCGESAAGIQIDGGTVTARGSHNGAGIGGGAFGSGRRITINGGLITAAGDGGAGIGGGSISRPDAGTDGVDIVIHGGVVTASGGPCGWGIGCGGSGRRSGVVIHSGLVTAVGLGGGETESVVIHGGVVTDILYGDWVQRHRGDEDAPPPF